MFKYIFYMYKLDTVADKSHFIPTDRVYISIY